MNFRTLKGKIEQATRLLMVNTITLANKSVLIVEYPKSGGTWLGQLISEYLDLPFPRNRMPVWSSSVFHSHYLPVGNIVRNKRIVYLVRDGRDVMVSLYFHQLIWNDKNRLNPKDVYFHRSRTAFDDFDNVAANMKEFLTYAFTSRPSKWQQFTYMGSWAFYNRAWLEEMKKGNQNIFLIRYEDLLEDTFGAMKALLRDHLGIAQVNEEKLWSTVIKFSFENQTNRKKGEENKGSFLRKGIAGDWKNYFGEAEKRYFKQQSGNLLIELGYEADMNW